MTTEERILLLKDLSGRLPYGVKIRTYSSINNFINNCGETIDEVLTYENIVKIPFNSRPYLRPMSSMTEEEKFKCPVCANFEDWRYGSIDLNAYNTELDITLVYNYIDWLNEHHFDYRGLIEKGLALEAPEGMYKF